MNTLAGLDPGAGGWIGAAATAAIIAVVALGAAGMARIWGRGRAAWRHDLYLAALALVLISPAIVSGVARSGAVFVALPEGAQEPRVEARPIKSPAFVAGPVERVDRPLSPPIAPPPPRDEGEFIAAVPAPIVIEGPAPDPGGEAPPFIEPSPAAVLAADQPASAAPAIGREAISGGLVAIWLAGVGLLATRLAYGLCRLASLRRRCRPADDPAIEGVLGDVRAALGQKLPPIVVGAMGPAAVGLVRPAVVLPPGLVGSIDRAELRDILIHECAHALRRDPLIGFFQRLAALIFWPHPLVHWLNRRLSMAREDVCDDYVLREGDACGYARALLSMALKAGPADRGMPAAVGFIGSRSRLERRIAGILSDGREPMTRGNRRLTAAAAAFLAAASIAVAGVRPAGTEATTEPAADEPTPQAAADPAGVPKTIIRGSVVDEAGAPVAGASVNVTWFRKAPADVRTGADGGFVLEIGGPIRIGELVRATDDRGRIGIAKYREPIFSEASPVRVVMKPPREMRASVVDGAGVPVAGADVEILAYGDGPLDRAETDAGGIARFRYPADGRVAAVVALKDGIGMDYFENYDSWPTDEFGALPGEIELALDGARTIQVKAEGSKGEGVPGVVLYHLSMKKPEKIASVNLSGSTLTKEETDAGGIARFRWVPATVQGGQGVEVDPWKYHAAKPVVVANDEEVMNVLGVRRNARVTGRVSDPDGRPVAGVLLQADGVGSAFRPGSGLAKTDDQGRFALDLPPNQIYSIMLLDRERAIAPFTGLVVREGQPRDGLDLRLVEPSRVRGHIIPIPKDPEAVGQSIRILFRGPKVPVEFNEEYGAEKLEYVMAWVSVDVQGNFQAALGPGKYQISTSEYEWEREIEIKKPGEDVFFDVQQAKEVEASRD